LAGRKGSSSKTTVNLMGEKSQELSCIINSPDAEVFLLKVAKGDQPL
jgi:hypothetical protein